MEPDPALHGRATRWHAMATAGNSAKQSLLPHMHPPHVASASPLVPSGHHLPGELDVPNLKAHGDGTASVKTLEIDKAEAAFLHARDFSLLDLLFVHLSTRKINSILVSGESGAGKTETTKMPMRYLAHLGRESGVEGRTVEVLETNPVLEAFGNAKIVRSNNSSPFGKFVEIQFDKTRRISGAAIRTYLLERSRVCEINASERNYHCFYFLCAAPPEDIQRYKLSDPRSFHYLNQSSCIEVDRINDAEEYLATRRVMDIVGINEEEQEAIFRVVAVVLHLGNIDLELSNVALISQG